MRDMLLHCLKLDAKLHWIIKLHSCTHSQGRREEFLSKVVQNSRECGWPGDPTTLTKSLDLHYYYNWHRSTLGVRTPEPPNRGPPPPPAAAPANRW